MLVSSVTGPKPADGSGFGANGLPGALEFPAWSKHFPAAG
jgi:hypothetical protein